MLTFGGATPLMYACQQCRENDVLEILSKHPFTVKERDRTLKTPLHYCAENVNVSCAEAILRIAPELVNAEDINGYCPLHLAVIAGNKPLIKLLIAKGADVNKLDNEGHSAVHWAIVSTEKEALETIIKAGANPSTPDIHGGYPLHYAVQMCGSNADNSRNLANSIKVVQTLLRNGVPVNVTDKDGRQPILWAASAGSAEAITYLISSGARVDSADKDGLTALHCAASRGHTSTIETLVTLCGADVDIIDGNGCSALFYAVTLGHADATELLLKYGAQPNRQDRKGRTPAHCGAAKGQLETLRILQKYHGNLWLRNVKGDLPFHEAVASGRKDLVLWLLSQNPEAVNIPNNDGRCALHIAAMYNNSEMIKVLLDSKSLVNPIMRSSKGVLMTPLNVAMYKNHRSCGKFLQLHGGVPFSKVSQWDGNFAHSMRVFPSEGINPKTVEYEEEIISPSFRIIKTNREHENQTNVQNVEKKKVYRRRRRRENSSGEKRIRQSESDSDDTEDSLQDLSLRAQNRRAAIQGNSENVDVENENDSNGEETKESNGKTYRKGYGKLEQKDAITSIILIGGDYFQSGFENDSRMKIVEISSEDANPEKLQRASSFNEHKNLSLLTPNDFPPTMESINHLDSEIAETEIDGSKTPTGTGVGIEVHDYKSIGGDANGNKQVEEAKTSDLISPAFTVLDENSLDEKTRSEAGEMTSPVLSKTSESHTAGKPERYSKNSKSEVESGKSGSDSPGRRDSLKSDKIKACHDEKQDKRKASQSKIAAEFDSKADIQKGENSATDISVKKNGKLENMEQPNDETSAAEPVHNIHASDVKASKIEESLKPDNADSTHSVDEKAIANGSKEEENSDEKNAERDRKSEHLIVTSDSEGTFFGHERLVSVEVHADPEPTKNESVSEKLNNKTTVVEENPIVPEAKETEISKNLTENERTVIKEVEEPSSSPDRPKVKNKTEAFSEESNNDTIEKVDDVLKEGEAVDNQELMEEVVLEKITTPLGDSAELVARISDFPPTSAENDVVVVDSTYLNFNQGASEEEDDPAETNESETLKSNASTKNENFNNNNYPHEKSWENQGEATPDGTANERTDLPSYDYKKENNWMTNEHRNNRTHRVSRLCRRNKDFKEINHISVTQLVQSTIRKYHLERGIFHQLLELKRQQIRAGRANEQLLVKRLADEYERSCASLGMRHYTGVYRFKDFEKFLYEQLSILNKGSIIVPDMKSHDDIDTLSKILKKSRFRFLSELPSYEPTCTCITQRCHHTTRAYTTLPCSAYIANLRRAKTSKQRKESFLPRIDQIPSYKSQRWRHEAHPATLELIQGNDKQVIELPPTNPEQGKKYYITFTIKSAQSFNEDEILTDDIKNYFKHRHAKSV